MLRSGGPCGWVRLRCSSMGRWGVGAWDGRLLADVLIAAGRVLLLWFGSVRDDNVLIDHMLTRVEQVMF